MSNKRWMNDANNGETTIPPSGHRVSWRTLYWIAGAVAAIGGPTIGLYVKNTMDIATTHADIVHLLATMEEVQRDVNRLEQQHMLAKAQCPQK